MIFAIITPNQFQLRPGVAVGLPENLSEGLGGPMLVGMSMG